MLFVQGNNQTIHSKETITSVSSSSVYEFVKEIGIYDDTNRESATCHYLLEVIRKHLASLQCISQLLLARMSTSGSLIFYVMQHLLLLLAYMYL